MREETGIIVDRRRSRKEERGMREEREERRGRERER
jgi:hypothetical protein